LGWRHLVHYNTRGTRFHAAGLGPATAGLRVDCYDNPGDYLASGMDGLEAHVHGNAQDQVCQIAKRGQLVVHGDVGQTFLYGGKGGDFYVLGNAAGRPMINAVGKPRAVINGTALDYLAESFMAGDPLAAAASPSSTASGSTNAARRPAGTCRIRAAICCPWPRAGRSTSATRTTRWWTSNSTAARTGRCPTRTGR